MRINVSKQQLPLVTVGAVKLDLTVALPVSLLRSLPRVRHGGSGADIARIPARSASPGQHNVVAAKCQ